MIDQSKFVSLLLTTHKNGVKGEYIRHGHIGYPQGYLVLAMRLQMDYLQLQGTTRETPISSFKKDKKCQQIQRDDIKATIRAVVQAAGPSIGFTEEDIITRSLRLGGRNVYPNDEGVPRHYPPGGEVTDRHDAPLPLHNGKELH